MSSIREKLTNMFSKVMAGTVTREEGTMLINHLAKEDPSGTVNELAYLVENPPPGVFQKTILHTISLARNKAFFGIMVSCLEHKNEEVSVLAAHELAKLRTAEARETLTEHLDSESYHVRKGSALAISEGLADGMEVLKSHMLRRSEPFYRLTFAQALGKSGKKGVEALPVALRGGAVRVEDIEARMDGRTRLVAVSSVQFTTGARTDLKTLGRLCSDWGITKTVSVQLGKPGDARARLSAAGVTFTVLGDEVRIATVKFGSRAKRGGFEQGWKVKAVKVRSDAPSEHWVFIPAFALIAFIWFLQRRRTLPWKRGARAGRGIASRGTGN